MSTLTVREDLDQHTETIYGWIKSCRKAIQLRICPELIEKLLVERFSPYVGKEIGKLDLSIAVTRLNDAIRNQEIIITQSKPERKPTESTY